MANSGKPGDRHDVLLEEHRLLTRHVAELDELAALAAGRNADWGAELGRRAADVHERLKAHFGGDAEGTFFSEVAQQAPHLLGKLTALTAEHAEILKEFRAIAESASQIGGDDGEATRVATRARRVVAVLRRHEAEENELIFKTFWDDIGTKD